MRDSLYDDTVARPALAIASRTAAATVNGITVDKNYQRNQFRSVMFIVHTGTITDGTTTFAMQDSPDNTNWTAVDAQYRQGTLPVVVAANDDITYEIGYTGSQRYVRLTATLAGATTGQVLGATCIMSDPRKTPVTH